MPVSTPEAIIAMQTWSLREAIARTFPQDRLLLLDLGGWNVEKFNSFWNYPYVAGVLHNYGGRVYMGGNLPLYARNAHELKKSPKGGNIQGIGLFPEAIEHNPVVYELSTEITWMQNARYWNSGSWIMHVPVTENYPKEPNKAGEYYWKRYIAIKLADYLVQKVLCARPALNIQKVAANGDLSRPYSTSRLWDAVNYSLQASDDLKASDTHRYDLVDVMRQCLSDLSLPLQKQITEAYQSGDNEKLQQAGDQFLTLIDDF